MSGHFYILHLLFHQLSCLVISKYKRRVVVYVYIITILHCSRVDTEYHVTRAICSVDWRETTLAYVQAYCLSVVLYWLWSSFLWCVMLSMINNCLNGFIVLFIFIMLIKYIHKDIFWFEKTKKEYGQFSIIKMLMPIFSKFCYS